MKYLIWFVAAVAILLSSCKDSKDTDPVHDEVNGVYYWKTVFDLDSADNLFIEMHHVGRMYMRMFDVVPDEHGEYPDELTVPNASLKVDMPGYEFLSSQSGKIDFVPVVYITLDALKTMADRESVLASNIVERVDHMCQYNGMTGVEELQLDCDWTQSTEKSFFKLCELVKAEIKERGLPWRLSSTIRLHQLSRPVPPVDNGVLMVYNTGAFDDPHARNSIIDYDDVEPYLKYLPSYDLHLDVAYPTYSWQLLFRERKFAGLLRDIDLDESDNFVKKSNNEYVVLGDVDYGDNTRLMANDEIRVESSDYAEVFKVKSKIEELLKDRQHSIILYHLDSKNMSKYNKDEITSLYHTGN